jgi:hypothetical protein
MSKKTEVSSRDDAEAMAKTAENSAGGAGTREMSDHDLEGVAGGIMPLPHRGVGPRSINSRIPYTELKFPKAPKR